MLQGGDAVCVCEDGYRPDGLNCVTGCAYDSDCDDGNVCTDEGCDIQTGCLYQYNNDYCGDGNRCTSNAFCSEGVCIEGEPLECDDANPCTVDSCDPATGCVFVDQVDGFPCDDGNACTLDDECASGACTGVLIDGDGDGVPPESCGGPDCDDTDPRIYGATEAFKGSLICTNGLDDDCDGVSDADEFECGIAMDVCDQNGWCQDHAFAVGNLNAIWGSSANDIWAAGDGVYRFDGQHWELVWDEPVRDVWGSAQTNVWVVGGGGRAPVWILQWDGSSWSDYCIGEVPGGMFYPQGVWGTSFFDVWTFGYVSPGEDHGSYVLHWDGATWRQSFFISSPDVSDDLRLYGIGGAAQDDVWVVGDSGLTVHWDGNEWSQVESGTEEGLASIVVWETDNAWAVGENGTVLQWNGVEWIHQDFGTQNYHEVWGLSPDDMWICGDSSAFHFNGSEWSEEPMSCGDLWGSSTDNVWKVGGAVSHWDGQAWTTLPVAITTENIEDVFAEDNSNIWAVGDTSVLYRSGSTWVDLARGRAGQSNNAVWSESPDDTWVAGDDGHIAHYDGTSWTTVDSSSTANLHAIWGARPDCIWAVGDDGVILYWDGTAWTPVESGTTETLRDVHGSSDTHVWAVGENTSVIRWDGQSWQDTEFTVDTGDPDMDDEAKVFSQVLVFSQDDVWAAAGLVAGDDSCFIFHWDGIEWSLQLTGATCRLAGSAGDNIWVSFRFVSPGCCAVGDRSVLQKWDGREWSETAPPCLPGGTAPTYKDLAVTRDGSVIAVGHADSADWTPGNLILRYQGCRNDEECHDASSCRVGRVCEAGLCTGGTQAAEGSPCNDGVFCNGEDSCDADGACSVHPGYPCGELLCDDILDICKGGAWYGPGGSDSGGIVSELTGKAQHPALALDDAGNLVVAWEQYVWDGESGNWDGKPKIYLKRFDASVPGGAWAEIGEGSASGQGISATSWRRSTDPSLALDGLGHPAVAWLEETGSTDVHETTVVHTKRFDGFSWIEIGAGSATGCGISFPEAIEHSDGWAEHPSLAIDGNGYPVVAWKWFADTPEEEPFVDEGIYVRRFNGSEWAEVGVGSASEGGISGNLSVSSPTLALDGDDLPVVAWTRNWPDTVINAGRFDGDSWVEVGAGSASEQGIIGSEDPDLVIDGTGTAVLACGRAVLEFDGNSWQELGYGLRPGTPSLALDSAGNPVVAWVGPGDVYLMRYDGSSWVELGEGSGSGGGFSNSGTVEGKASLAIGGQRICVAWADSQDIFVRCVDEESP